MVDSTPRFLVGNSSIIRQKNVVIPYFFVIFAPLYIENKIWKSQRNHLWE